MGEDPNTSAELHRRIREIFLEVRSLKPGARRSFLDRVCRGAPTVRSEVESLLEFDDGEVSPIDSSPVGLGFSVPTIGEVWNEGQQGSDEAESVPRPSRIGSYRIVSQLGQGSMGVVYLAEQELTNRHVAIKILRKRAHSQDRLKRFEHEARVLGQLKHSGIAQIYEASTADLGTGPQMYFAMEYVDGPSITSYARNNELDDLRRAALLEQVCHAVDHAHCRSVLHRDLKPENILVDPAGAAKVLDFGVALCKVDEERDELRSLEEGRLVGTPAYMSPEQLKGASASVDERSDVYALGVIAHEIFTGELPSDNLAELDEARLGPDLAAILRAALSPAPEARYSSAADLAADLRRFRLNEPVRVREATAGYLLRKFARRRRSLAIALAALILLLITAAVVSMVLTFQVRREAAQNETLVEFLREILISPRPKFRGSEVTVLEVLDGAEGMIQRRLSEEPEVEARVRVTLGAVYQQLGNVESAEPHLRNAVELFRLALGEDALETKLARLELAALLVNHMEEYSEALILLEGLLADADHDQRLSTSQRVRALGLEARVLRSMGQYDLAIERYLAAETLAGEGAVEPTASVLSTRSFRARALSESGEHAEAEALARSTLALERQLLGEEHRLTLISMFTLATVLINSFELDSDPIREAEAELLIRQAIEGRSRLLGANHPGTLSAIEELAALLERKGMLEEAISYQTSAFEGYRDGLGLNRLLTRRSQEALTRMLIAGGRGDEAERLRDLMQGD